MKRLLIHFAHPLEAKASLERLNAQAISDHLYTFEHGQIVISGMGLIAAAASTAAHLPHADEVWNLGVVGALKDLPIGAVGEVKTVSRHLHEATELTDSINQPISLHENGWHLVSVDTPVHTTKQRAMLLGDIVDMEGYAVARAAYMALRPCRMFKVVSDLADGKIDIAGQLPKLSESLANLLLSKLETCA